MKSASKLSFLAWSNADSDLCVGGSQNTAIAKLAGEILGGVEGVYRLDVGAKACALGSACTLCILLKNPFVT